MTTIYKFKKEWGINPQSSGTDLTKDEKSIADNLQELMGTEHKLFVERKSTLDHNISKLYGIVWGQCIPDLKEDTIGLEEY